MHKFCNSDIITWQEQELKAAGVPVPPEASFEKKSYTLPADRGAGRCAIGVLWLGCIIMF